MQAAVCVCVSNSWEAWENLFFFVCADFLHICFNVSVQMSTFFTICEGHIYIFFFTYCCSSLCLCSVHHSWCCSWKITFICMLISLHERFLSKVLGCIFICRTISSHKTNHYSFSIQNPKWLHSHKCNSQFLRWMLIAFHHVLYWNTTIFYF